MEKILVRIRVYVTELFQRRKYSFLKYHNFQHTETVVERATEIAHHFSLSESELFCLLAASWFHDTGHLFNELSEHEKAGADLCSAFLKSFSLDENMIHEVEACIMVTKMPSHPKTTIEKIICDADTYHFGTGQFFETDQRVYEEMEERLGLKINHKTEKSIKLLQKHAFFTTYCQDLLNKGKLRNIRRLQKLLGGLN